jgi:hypothetical protein
MSLKIESTMASSQPSAILFSSLRYPQSWAHRIFARIPSIVSVGVSAIFLSKPNVISFGLSALPESFPVTARLLAERCLVRRHDFRTTQSKFFGCHFGPRYHYGPVAPRPVRFQDVDRIDCRAVDVSGRSQPFTAIPGFPFSPWGHAGAQLNQAIGMRDRTSSNTKPPRTAAASSFDSRMIGPPA